MAYFSTWPPHENQVSKTRFITLINKHTREEPKKKKKKKRTQAARQCATQARQRSPQHAIWAVRDPGSAQPRPSVTQATRDPGRAWPRQRATQAAHDPSNARPRQHATSLWFGFLKFFLGISASLIWVSPSDLDFLNFFLGMSASLIWVSPSDLDFWNFFLGIPQQNQYIL